MPIQRSGQCVCGSVRYVCIGEPERVTICHCLWCQRRTGTAFGIEVVFQEEKVTFSGLNPASYRHTSDESGRWLRSISVLDAVLISGLRCRRCLVFAQCRQAHLTSQPS